MALDPNDSTHPRNCDSVEQQDARILHRWASDPDGRYTNWISHEERLWFTLANFVGRALQTSSDPLVQTYLIGSEGFELVSYQEPPASYKFSGILNWGDGKTNRGWLAPFDLHVTYLTGSSEIPTKVMLKFGARDGEGDIRRFPQGLSLDRASNANQVLKARPETDGDWGIIVVLDANAEQVDLST